MSSDWSNSAPGLTGSVSPRASFFDTAIFSLKAGAIPGTILSALGDFFSPSGLWALPLLFGLATSCLWLLFCSFANLRKWASGLFSQEHRDRYWSEPFISSAASWSLIVFSACGIVFGSVSYKKAAVGGIISENIPMAASLQRMAGITEKALVEQKKTRKGVEELVRIGKTGEADNPRVTLSNRGIQWSVSSLSEALINEDVETIELFLRGGMSIGPAVSGQGQIDLVAYFLGDYRPKTAQVFIEHADEIPAKACLPSGFGMFYDASLQYWELDKPHNLSLYTKICDKPEVLAYIKERADSERARNQHADSFHEKLLDAFR